MDRKLPGAGLALPVLLQIKNFRIPAETRKRQKKGEKKKNITITCGDGDGKKNYLLNFLRGFLLV